VFHGSSVEGREVSLVLDAKGIAYERIEAGGECTLLVAASAAGMAREELARYAAERAPPREPGATFVPFRGSAAAAGAYAGVLILVAYCAGIQLFGVDWFDAGALQSTPGAPAEWWRTITALTLHLDQEHLMGNLLFGAGIGLLAGRVFGPGFAWLSMLAAGAAGNALEMWVSPAGHRAVGASTAVFAALGLLAGFGWGQRTAARDRRLYRWAPLFGGVCLLALLGAGTEHVDVLGHMLGFTCGILLGWLFARLGWPPRGSAALQPAAGALALLLVGAAWAIAIR
jgi:membrane associated rhomboid family serine protease